MNLANMMKQAQDVQTRLKAAQEDLDNMDVVVSSDDKDVTVTLNGHGKFKSIDVQKSSKWSSVDEATIKELISAITSVMNQATSQANEISQNKLKGVVPAGLNIPGLF